MTTPQPLVRDDPTSTLTRAAGALLGITMLLLLHRYAGIASDSILYMGQALAQIYPDIFAHDLFFQYGSQSKYSLLPWVLGKFLSFSSLPALFMWGTLFSLLLFSAASWLALRELLPPRQRYWAWLGVLCLPGIYAVVHIFSYNEAFLTSRPFAESFCLLTIASLMRRRWLVSASCLSVAGLLHPLQAIAAVLVILPFLILRDRRWLHALWLGLPIMLLAWLGISPFNGLWQELDPAWYASMQHSGHVFVSQWSLNDYKVLAFDICLLLLGWRLLPRDFSRWCIAGLIGLFLGLGASFLLVDVLHLVLPTGLQLWRVHWLAHWFAISALVAILFHHVSQRDFGRALVLVLMAQLAWGETTFGWVAMLALYLSWPLMIRPPRERLAPLLSWILAAVLAFLLFSHVSNEWKWFSASGYQLDLYPLDLRILIFPAISLGLPLLGLFLWSRSPKVGRLFLFWFALVPALAFAAHAWDARRSESLPFEITANHTDIFGPALPEGAQVLWIPENLVANWLILHRASYFSNSQLSGQMFNRETARIGNLRLNKIQPLLLSSQRCLRDTPTPELLSQCQIDSPALRAACAHGETMPPDFIVMTHHQPQRSRGRWIVVNPVTHQIANTYYLYSCDDLLHDLSRSSDGTRDGDQ